MNNKLVRYFKNKKILVTGHTGFKGSWLCIFLNFLEAEVYGISLDIKKGSLFEKAKIKNKIKKHFIFDIRNKSKLNKVFSQINPDIVIHFAAQSLVLNGYNYPVKTFDINFNGTLNLLEAYVQNKNAKKILITTTDKVYEKNNKKIFKERDKLWGFDPYSASKVCKEQLVESYRHLNKNRKKIFLVARSGNVIGGGDISKDRIIPDIIKSIKNHSILYIRNPNSIRPWQHVVDALYGYLLLLYKRKNFLENDNWNFGPENKNFKKVIDIVKNFKENFNFKYKLKKNKNKETEILKLNSDKAKQKLMWQSKLNFKNSLNYIFYYEKLIKKKINPYNICLEQIKNYISKKV